MSKLHDEWKWEPSVEFASERCFLIHETLPLVYRGTADGKTIYWIRVAGSVYTKIKTRPTVAGPFDTVEDVAAAYFMLFGEKI